MEKAKKAFAGTEIKGKTLGVIGLGAIGVLVADAAVALGMKVIGCDPYLSVANVCTRSVKYYNSFFGTLLKGNIIDACSGSCHCGQTVRKLQFMHGCTSDKDAFRLSRRDRD